jgi:hypothetical protein
MRRIKMMRRMRITKMMILGMTIILVRIRLCRCGQCYVSKNLNVFMCILVEYFVVTDLDIVGKP